MPAAVGTKRKGMKRVMDKVDRSFFSFFLRDVSFTWEYLRGTPLDFFLLNENHENAGYGKTSVCEAGQTS